MSAEEEAAGFGPRLSALADPVRRGLYEFVVSRGVPTRRDEAAGALDISRTLAAYHLDRLVGAGLLVTSYTRPEGRGGPGAGRPAKHYAPAQEEVDLTVPPRTYGLLARMLSDAIDADTSGGVADALMSAAEEEGRVAAADFDDLADGLRGRGYEPVVDDNGGIQLANCPFHQLAKRHTDLVCGLNHALLRSLLAARAEDPGRAELAPSAGHCCVVIHPAGEASRSEVRGSE